MKLRFLSLLLLVSCQTVSRKPAASVEFDLCELVFEASFEAIKYEEGLDFLLTQGNYLKSAYVTEAQKKAAVNQCPLVNLDQRLSQVSRFSEMLGDQKLMFEELESGQLFTDPLYPEKAACFMECSGADQEDCEKKCNIRKEAVTGTHQFFKVDALAQACYDLSSGQKFRHEKFKQNLAHFLPVYRAFMLRNRQTAARAVDSLLLAHERLKKLRNEIAPSNSEKGTCPAEPRPKFLDQIRQAVFVIQKEKESATAGAFRITDGTGFWVQGKNGEGRYFSAYHVRNDKGVDFNDDERKKFFVDGSGVSTQNKFMSDVGYFNFEMDIAQGKGDHRGPFLKVNSAGSLPAVNQKFYVLGYPSAGGGELKILPCSFRGYVQRVQPGANGTSMQFYCDQPFTFLEGISGGPVLDESGTVWAVVTDRSSPAGLVFASPIFRAADGDLQMGFQETQLSNLCLNPRDWSSLQRCQLMPNQFEKQIP